MVSSPVESAFRANLDDQYNKDDESAACDDVVYPGGGAHVTLKAGVISVVDRTASTRP
jgi:hypothetical protein